MTANANEARRFCEETLPAVSRTFALSIRILPGDLGIAVRDAYLLCRIADTIEDAPGIAAGDKASMLDDLAACFEDSSRAGSLARRLAPITGDDAHVRLARGADLVFSDFSSLPPA